GRSRSDGGRVRYAGGDHRPGRGGVTRAGGAFRRPVGALLRSRTRSRSRSRSRSSSWTPAPEDLPPITSRLSWTNSLRRRTRIRGVLSVHSSRPPGPCLGPGAAGRIVVEGDTPVAPGVQHRLDDAPRLD